MPAICELRWVSDSEVLKRHDGQRLYVTSTKGGQELGLAVNPKEEKATRNLV